MSNFRKKINIPNAYVAYFSVCQDINLRLSEYGNGVSKSGINGFIFHDEIIDDLELLKNFCDRAIKTLNKIKDEFDDSYEHKGPFGSWKKNKDTRTIEEVLIDHGE